jgi:uncharacterized phosphosugar-binding protein
MPSYPATGQPPLRIQAGEKVNRPGDGLDRYFSALQSLQNKVITSQRETLLAIAARMAECVQRDDRILLFGTGHSHMLAEEGHYRAGGLANVVPMLQSALMLHEGSILSGRLERTPGLARPVFERYQPQAGELLFVFSNSGVNVAPVEMALLAKEHGSISVAVCSLAYARAAPLSSAGRRLFEVTDYVIDNGGEQGDSLIALDDTLWRVGPSSTVINALLWNALVTEAAFILQTRGAPIPVYKSSNLPDGAQHNAALLQKWRGRNPHL